VTVAQCSRDPDSPAVTVRGEAAIRTEPDEAFVLVMLERTELTAGPALADVTTRAAALIQLLDELGLQVQERSTTGVTIGERFEHTESGRQSLGLRVSTAVSVRFSGMQNIGVLITRSSRELDARINGPNWRVSPDHPVRLEAATRAASNALQKATAYASGLNMQVGPILSLREPEHVGHGFVQAGGRSSRSDLPIESGEQEIAAVIEATFALIANTD
jgi:uncharacterized protein YggE